MPPESNVNKSYSLVELGIFAQIDVFSKDKNHVGSAYFSASHKKLLYVNNWSAILMERCCHSHKLRCKYQCPQVLNSRFCDKQILSSLHLYEI